MNELEKVSKEEIEFNKLKLKCSEVVARANGLSIYDATTLQIATQVLSEVKQAYDNVEAKRKDLKRPHHEAGLAVDKLAKVLSTPLELALNGGKSKIMKFNMEEEKKAEKKRQEIEAIRIQIANYSKTTMIAIDFARSEKELKDIWDKDIKVGVFPGEEKWKELLPEANVMRSNLQDYIKQAKIDLLTPQQADPEVKAIIKEVAVEQVATVGQDQIKAATFTSSTKFRDSQMKFELVDISAVPAEWLTVDEDKVKAYIKANKDTLKAGDLKNGFRFFKEQSVVIK